MASQDHPARAGPSIMVCAAGGCLRCTPRVAMQLAEIHLIERPREMANRRFGPSRFANAKNALPQREFERVG
jgi:hypothetical protein